MYIIQTGIYQYPKAEIPCKGYYMIMMASINSKNVLKESSNTFTNKIQPPKHRLDNRIGVMMQTP
jgi:hypothetical protein